jgi:hypothetical protein
LGLSDNPARAARRKTELRERLGAEKAACFYCGYSNPVALRRISQKSLPEHHVLGRNHDPDLVITICLNCHAEAHESLANEVVELEPIADAVKRVATMLRAEAVHLEMWAESKRKQAALLEAR